MSQVIEEARDLLQSRLDDLKDETSTIERALTSLNGGPKPKRVGRPRKAAGSSRAVKAAASKPRTRRARKGGTRADQAVELITKAGKEGIAASAVAKIMKIKPNYLYRVLGDLEKEGRVKKDGRTYYPA